MWLPTDIIAEVDKLVRIYYIDMHTTKQWNEHRHKDELRLLTGWCWASRNGRQHRQGFKTPTVAYRDAYYTLVAHETAPIPQANRPRLRVIERKSANG